MGRIVKDSRKRVLGNKEFSGGKEVVGSFIIKDRNFNVIYEFNPDTNTVTVYDSSGNIIWQVNTSTGLFDFQVWKIIASEDWGTNKCTGGTASAETENPPSEGAAQAFDDDFDTKWLALSNSSPWIQYQFPSDNAYQIQKYTITSGGDFADRDPKSWQLQGSNNGTDWTTLHTVSDFWFGPRLIMKEFYFINNDSYKYYRLNITANWGSTDTQIQEIQMFEFNG